MDGVRAARSITSGALRRRGPEVRSAGRRFARRTFIARAKLAAALADAHLELDVHPEAVISPGARVEVWPGTSTRVVIGPRTTLGDRALISLRGGLLSIGADTQLRRFATLQVSGELRIGDGVVMSTGLVVHCADAVDIGDLTIIGEYSTIADSSHVRTPPGVPVHHATRTSPVRIGTNCWFGAGIVVAPGVTVGDQCFVGARAVVTRDVEDGWLVAGVPARPVRRLELES